MAGLAPPPMSICHDLGGQGTGRAAPHCALSWGHVGLAPMPGGRAPGQDHGQWWRDQYPQPEWTPGPIATGARSPICQPQHTGRPAGHPVTYLCSNKKQAGGGVPVNRVVASKRLQLWYGCQSPWTGQVGTGILARGRHAAHLIMEVHAGEIPPAPVPPDLDQALPRQNRQAGT